LRAKVHGRIVEEHKMGFYAASRVDVYQLMVSICLRLKNDKEAFEYAERSKSKVFLYLLAASNIRPSAPIVTSELKLLPSLKKFKQICLLDVKNPVYLA
ncbi:MAG TPA: hypothetical protein VFJ51_02910, partial [Nitrososphaeraceae archaeon]|nr:hypothetical protein [Nitrososphaeraceae archaeon]